MASPLHFSKSLVVIVLCGVILAASAPFGPTLPVSTSSGLVFGHAASGQSSVTEFLGIPYGRSPTGDLRFAPPKPYRSRSLVMASKYSPDCPAVTTTSSIGQSNIRMASQQGIATFDDINRLGHRISEDCLKLNIWARSDSSSLKPVMVRIPGGAFQTQTTNSTFLYNGQFLADTQDVVIVTINYRPNIFGFPGLPGAEKNLGLLDQRLAIEWVKHNIKAFGGDPSRITLFGESTGGTSIDYYSFAYRHDPIVVGLIAESSTSISFSNPAPSDNIASFNTIASAVNCPEASTADSSSSLSCMRSKPMEDIISAYAKSKLQMNPTVDNKTVFPNYVELAASGKFAKIPMLVGNNDYECGIIKVFFQQSGMTLNDQQYAILNLQMFSCPVGAIARTKSKFIPLWRYRYYGDFPNTRLTLNPNSGGWHGAEIPAVFGTAESSGQVNTHDEAQIIDYIMGAWTAFAKDPVNGLRRAPYSWPQYDYNDQTLVRLAYKNETKASYEWPVTYDYACDSVITPTGPDQEALAKISNITALGGGTKINYGLP